MFILRKSLEDTDNVSLRTRTCLLTDLKDFSLEKKTGMYTTLIRDLSSLNSMFLSFHAIHWTHEYHFVSFMSPCRNCGLEKWHKNKDTQTTAISVSNKWSFVSYPGILCLQPASMKLKHTNFLTCNCVKSQTLVTLLYVF